MSSNNMETSTIRLDVSDNADYFVLTHALEEIRDRWQDEADDDASTDDTRREMAADYAARAEALRLQIEEQI